MSFPETRPTLIRRIVADSAEEDWRQLLADYWGPVCRFAARRGNLNADDAEDVASITFEAIIRNDLLSRWVANRQSKLRTLLCAVTRNIISNLARVRDARKRRTQDHGGALDHLVAAGFDDLAELPNNDADPFLLAWAEELLQRSVESLLYEYHSEGRGDYFRALYGKVCEQMTARKIAESLGCKVTDVENYHRHAKNRLETTLRRLLQEHVGRYSSPEEAGEEFEQEWQRLGDCLKSHGGLEQVLRDSYRSFDADELRRRESQSMTQILKQVNSYRRKTDISKSE